MKIYLDAGVNAQGEDCMGNSDMVILKAVSHCGLFTVQAII